MADPAAAVRTQAQPLADAAGLDLVDVLVKGNGPRTLVRVVVDRKGGVDIAECQRLSKDLSKQLDDVDPIDARYSLEVTSPGVALPCPAMKRWFRSSNATNSTFWRPASASRQSRKSSSVDW